VVGVVVVVVEVVVVVVVVVMGKLSVVEYQKGEGKLRRAGAATHAIESHWVRGNTGRQAHCVIIHVGEHAQNKSSSSSSLSSSACGCL
jgi:hypothetical protein